MKILSAIAEGFSYWIEAVAETVITLHGWLRRRASSSWSKGCRRIRGSGRSANH